MTKLQVPAPVLDVELLFPSCCGVLSLSLGCLMPILQPVVRTVRVAGRSEQLLGLIWTGGEGEGWLNMHTRA